MKRSSIYKNDTSWLVGLLIHSILCAVMFFASAAVFGIVMWYQNDLAKVGEIKNTFKYDVVAFPITLVLTVFELFSCIYFIWNYVLWCQSFLKSNGKRKKFNLTVVVVGIILLVILIIDTVLKLIGSFKVLPIYIQNWAGSQELVVGKTSFFLKPYILLGLSLIGWFFYLAMFILQSHWFKSEVHENSTESTQSHYRKLEMDKKRNLIKRQKQKDLSKKIKVF